MASNKDLEAKILELDAEASTTDLKNAELEALLKELQAEAAAEAELKADEDAAKEAADAKAKVNAEKAADAEAAAEAGRKPGLYICEGKSVTSAKGLLDAGDGPFKADLFTDKKNVKRLIDAGVLEIEK